MTTREEVLKWMTEHDASVLEYAQAHNLEVTIVWKMLGVSGADN